MEKLVQRLVREELMFRKELVVLGYARDCGNNAESCRECEVLSKGLTQPSVTTSIAL